MPRGPFTRRDAPAARAFVRSVLTAGGTAPISRRAVNPDKWTPAYAARIANALRDQARRGDPLSLQAARRGATLAKATRVREGHAPTRVRSTGLVSIERRSAETIIRLLRNRPEFPDGAFQVTASGLLLAEYSSIGYTMGGESWRTILTGFGGSLRSSVGEDIATDDLTADTLRRIASAMFERVDTWELRVIP